MGFVSLLRAIWRGFVTWHGACLVEVRCAPANDAVPIRLRNGPKNNFKEGKGQMSSTVGRKLTLAEYLEGVISDHAVINGQRVVLDVTDDEAREFGLMFIRGLCGFFLGLDDARRLRQVEQDAETANDYHLINQVMDDEQYDDDEDKEDFVN
jgi:hypothetical protein